jgi:hypothetical protein
MQTASSGRGRGVPGSGRGGAPGVLVEVPPVVGYVDLGSVTELDDAPVSGHDGWLRVDRGVGLRGGMKEGGRLVLVWCACLCVREMEGVRVSE